MSIQRCSFVMMSITEVVFYLNLVFSGNNFNGDTLQFSSREQC